MGCTDDRKPWMRQTGRSPPLSPLSPSIGAAAGLGAALCWTIASQIWRSLPTSLDAARLNLIKNLLASALLLPLALATSWRVDASSALLLAVSGVVGIAMGDTLFFAALRRLGTRRALTLDAGGPAVTTLAGVSLLGEIPRLGQWLGVGLISVAITLVARERPGRCSISPLPLDVQGVVLGIAALLCGSSGAILARLALRSGEAAPLQAATLRLVAASLAMLPLLRGMPMPGRRPLPARRRWPWMLLATLLGTSLGILLQQTALAGLPGGMAVALLATAPVLAIPLARLEGDRPGWRGWVAGLAAMVGVSLVVGLPWGLLP